jgi:sec-independent protein translocase protein TatC
MNDAKMTFTEHLAELRIRLVKAMAVVMLFSVLGFFFRGYVLEVIKVPLGENVPLHAFDLFEEFYASIKLAVYTGLFLGLPFVVYQILMFCLPALRPNEKRVIVTGLIAGVILLYCGILFSYVLVLPQLMPQLSGFFKTGVEQTFSLNMYIDKIFRFVIAFGLAFQMPIVLIILVRIGVVSVQALRRNRKYMIILVFVIAAILTPPDALSQILLAIPLLFLYEASIWISVLLGRRANSS